MPALRRFVLSLCAAAALSASAASAQTPPPGGAPPPWVQQLDAYMARQSFKNEVAYFTREFERMRRGSCENVQVLDIGRLLLGPIQFDSAGVPSNGTWRTQILVNRCGRQVVHNVLYAAQPGKIVPSGMFPGATRTPLAMQDGVAVSMRKFIRERTTPPADCRLFVIMDTQMGLPLTGANAPDRWTERWTIQQCDQFNDVLVDFQVRDGAISFTYRMG